MWGDYLEEEYGLCEVKQIDNPKNNKRQGGFWLLCCLLISKQALFPYFVLPDGWGREEDLDYD